VHIATIEPPTPIVHLTARTVIFAGPSALTAITTLGPTTEFGTPRVLPATQLRGDWIEVMLPTRPDGSRGWVRTTDVSVSTVDDHVTVDLAARTLVWTRAGLVQLEIPVAIGAPATPTPPGTYFVTDVLPQANPNGPYGAWIVALNGHALIPQTPTTDYRLAIHGTDAPGSIGSAASNGCLRVAAPALAALATALAAGTVVTVA
jgi:hypothetical protein